MMVVMMMTVAAQQQTTNETSWPVPFKKTLFEPQLKFLKEGEEV